MNAFQAISGLKPIALEDRQLNSIYIDLGNGNRHEMKVWNIIDRLDMMGIFLTFLDRDFREYQLFHKDNVLKSNLVQ